MKLEKTEETAVRLSSIEVCGLGEQGGFLYLVVESVKVLIFHETLCILVTDKAFGRNRGGGGALFGYNSLVTHLQPSDFTSGGGD